MTAPTFDLFACVPYSARMTRKACAANYRMMNSSSKTTMQGTAMVGSGMGVRRAYGRIHCVECEIGKAHAAGKVVPVERMTWKRDAAAAASAPSPAPMTEVPRVEGVLDEKTHEKEEATVQTNHQPRTARMRTEAVADVGAGMSIAQTAAKHGVSGQTIRNWLKDVGAATPSATPPSGTTREEAVTSALDKTRSIRMHAQAMGVSPSALRAWLVSAGHNPLDWPTTAQVTAREQRREKPEQREENLPTDEALLDDADHDEPSLTDVVHPPEPRIMDRTELVEDEPGAPPDPGPPPTEPAPPAPLPEAAAEWLSKIRARANLDQSLETLLPVALVVPPRVGRIIARLGVSAGVAHVVSCLYMAGLAQGRGDNELVKVWTDDAAAASVDEVERVGGDRTRGAA
jgi:transposase-like protein